MGKTITYEAIVLQTHDVGEADRFCILLTRERGRLAARARSVRKLKSKMGGSILPLRCLTLDLYEGNSGFLITAVHESSEDHPKTIQPFLYAEQGIELLLKLLEDDEAIPEIFDTAKEFLKQCSTSSLSPVLPFTIRLLVLLGLFPSPKEGLLRQKLHNEESVFLETCMSETWWRAPPISLQQKQRIHTLCLRLIAQQTPQELRAGLVAAAIG